MSNSIILGIDPGSNLLGYAVLEVGKQGSKPRLLIMDTLDIRGDEDHPTKLKHIFETVQSIIDQYQPTTAGIEAPFYGKDAQAMLKLGRAQGTAIAAIACKGIAVTEYSPRSVKKAVTGNGNASKEQLAGMLQHVVEGEIQSKFIDASDAVGVAYCHYINTNGRGGNSVGGKKSSGWGNFLKDNPDRVG